MTSSYQPFPITEYKTGLFNYLEPWIRPIEAFEPLSNAYIYRGTLNKRGGSTEFGRLNYRDNGFQIAVGNGAKPYSGTLTIHPIRAGSFTATDGVESFTDNGLGVLTGSSGGTGTINYTTGAWALNFNANVGVGVIIRSGYTYIPTQITAALSRPIMGLKQWNDETTGTSKLVGFDTRRAALYNNSTNQFDPLSSVVQIIWTGDGSTTSITVQTQWVAVSPATNALAPYSISITDGTSTISDDGVGNLSASGNFAAAGTVNYATGAILLNFTAAPASTINITLTCSLAGDYFNGANSNFINECNWLGSMYITNNVDFITLFNGTTLSRPPFPITAAHQITYTNDIKTCLDVDVYKNRLLVQRPTLVGTTTPEGQSFRYSAILNPTNLVADVTGNGGEISAPTDDFIQSSGFLRDQIIVYFTNSAWIFRFSGSGFDPFRWDKINSSKSCNAPYGTIEYDERVTAMGSKGLIASDGVNVQRYDINVIDQFLDINQNKFAQCYGLRFDSSNQSYMLYPSADEDNSISNKILVYNFLENSWATYDLPLSCVGLFYVTQDKTWNDFAVGQPLATDWNNADFTWNSYLLQDLAPVLLGGGHTGIVSLLNSGDTDLGTSIESSITSAKWNPFAGEGMAVAFGYVDFYYEINSDVTLTLSFFLDNDTTTAATRTLTLDGSINSDYAWKRIYLNFRGEFVRMNIETSDDGTWKILGMILWARPAGRLTP